MIGIVPCAGSNERWGSSMKELLPIGEYRWLLDTTIRSLQNAGCERIIIGSSPSKIGQHLTHVQRLGIKNISFVLGGSTMWETLFNMLPYLLSDYCLMMMPDTLTSLSGWEPTDNDIDFGLFTTDTPERFSIFDDGKIITKPKHFSGGKYQAWGVVGWSPRLSKYWLTTMPDDYDEAFSVAMISHSWGTFTLPYYYDFANWKSYSDYIKEGPQYDS